MKNSKFLTKLFAMSAAVVMALTSFTMPANAGENESVSSSIEDDEYVTLTQKFELSDEMLTYSKSNDVYGEENNAFQLVNGEKFDVVKYMGLTNEKKQIKKFSVEVVSGNKIKTKVSKKGKVSKIKRAVIKITAEMKDGKKVGPIKVDTYAPKKSKVSKADKNLTDKNSVCLNSIVEGTPAFGTVSSNGLIYQDYHFVVYTSTKVKKSESIKADANPIFKGLIFDENANLYLVRSDKKIDYKVLGLSIGVGYCNDQEIKDQLESYQQKNPSDVYLTKFKMKPKKKIMVSGFKLKNK